MGLFDTLDEEKRAFEEARRKDERSTLETQLQHEVGRRPEEATQYGSGNEIEIKYRQARQYYDESGCETYIGMIVAHLRYIRGFPTAAATGNLHSFYPGPFGRVFLDFTDVFKPESAYIYRLINWQKEEGEGIDKYGEYFRIYIGMDSDGVLIIAGKKTKKLGLDQWRGDKRLIDEAIDEAYRSPVSGRYRLNIT